LHSARHAAEYDEIAEMFGDLYPDVAVPKTAGRWISAVQYQMARVGEHRSASAVDLIIAATAAHHGLTVLHDDADYRTVARHSHDLAEQNIHDLAL
jgi:predicted nucleic acid-binding protein